MYRSIARQAVRGARIACLVGAVSLALIGGGWAETVQFTATLKGASELPPNQTTGSGTVTAKYDSTTRIITWTGSYSGLTGPASAAHVHGPAAVGANARAIVWMVDNFGQCANGECRTKAEAKVPVLPSPFNGSAKLTEEQSAELLAGKYYVNIHTDAHPAGELRGQLTRSP